MTIEHLTKDEVRHRIRQLTADLCHHQDCPTDEDLKIRISEYQWLLGEDE